MKKYEIWKFGEKNDDMEMGIGETLIRIEIDHTHLPFLTLVPFFVSSFVLFSFEWSHPPSFLFLGRFFYVYFFPSLNTLSKNRTKST